MAGSQSAGWCHAEKQPRYMVRGMSPNTLHEGAFHVLTALARRPQHGYTLIEDVARLSEGRVQLRTGTVYSILDRLKEACLIEVDREEIVSSRLRRYYRLTDAGAAMLSAECEALRRRVNVADRSLRPWQQA
jgi:DNA-binding PadR family transcriptional regulator